MADEEPTPSKRPAASRGRTRDAKDRASASQTKRDVFRVADLMQQGLWSDEEREVLQRRRKISPRQVSEIATRASLVVAARMRPKDRLARLEYYAGRALRTADKNHNPTATALLIKSELEVIKHIEEARGAEWLAGLVSRMLDRIMPNDRATQNWLIDELDRQIEIEERGSGNGGGRLLPQATVVVDAEVTAEPPNADSTRDTRTLGDLILDHQRREP